MRKSLLLASIGLLAAAAPAAMAGEAFGVNLRGTANLRQFPANDPTMIGNIVAPIAISTFATDFNTAGTSLYAIRNIDATNWDLGTIDLTTGAYTTTIGITGLTGNPTGLRIDPTNETYYVSNATTLFTLNTGTGALTPVGNFGGGSTLMIDIAIDNNGNMYGHDIATDSLYSIDKTTGAATVIGAHGLAANFAQGMDFDPETNILYAAIYTGGGTGSYVSWNLGDGSVNILGSTTSFNVEMELAIRVPAPGIAATLGLAGAPLLLRRRR